MNWLYYLLEANIYLTIGYLLYHLVFRKYTFYRANRFYLLGIVIVAFLLPLFSVQVVIEKSIPFIQQSDIVFRGYYNLIDISSVPVAIHSPEPAERYLVTQDNWSVSEWLLLLYLSGVIFMLIKFFKNFFDLLRIGRCCVTYRSGNITYVVLRKEMGAFSFFRRIYYYENTPGIQMTLAHERVHVNEWHSVDVVISEMMKCVCWFNPFIFIWDRQIRLVHEFIADREVSTKSDSKYGYAMLLVESALWGVERLPVNTLSSSAQLRQRLLMLNKEKSPSRYQKLYWYCLPLFLGLFSLVTLVIPKDHALIHYSIIKHSTMPESLYPVSESSHMPVILQNDSTKVVQASGKAPLYKEKSAQSDKTAPVYSKEITLPEVSIPASIDWQLKKANPGDDALLVEGEIADTLYTSPGTYTVPNPQLPDGFNKTTLHVSCQTLYVFLDTDAPKLKVKPLVVVENGVKVKEVEYRSVYAAIRDHICRFIEGSYDHTNDQDSVLTSIVARAVPMLDKINRQTGDNNSDGRLLVLNSELVDKEPLVILDIVNASMRELSSHEAVSIYGDAGVKGAIELDGQVVSKRQMVYSRIVTDEATGRRYMK